MVLATVGGALFIHTFSERYGGMGIGDVYGPMFFPRILLAAWTLFALIAAIQAALSANQNGVQFLRLWFGLAIMMTTGLFVAAILTLGFLIGSYMFFIASALILGYRNPVVLSIAGVAVPFAIWYLFHVIIEIRLPTSNWLIWI